ncbi:hypothetical protein G7009_08145 [Pseudomonas capeferrum]|nr:hypothetical protein [Pseudomonas capeferrum]
MRACCYEVGRTLDHQIEYVHGHLWRGRLAPWSTSREESELSLRFCRAPASHNEAWLDLSLYCLYLLEAAGVNPDLVQTAEICTYCSGHEWGSYRRRTHQGDEKTFHYSWISLRAGGA